MPTGTSPADGVALVTDSIIVFAARVNTGILMLVKIRGQVYGTQFSNLYNLAPLFLNRPTLMVAASARTPCFPLALMFSIIQIRMSRVLL